MAHFAELDENNVVLQVIVVHNNELKGANGVEYENKGVEFCSSLFGHTNWVQTSYNNNIRKQFAGQAIPTTQTVMSLLRLSRTQVGL